MKRSEIAILFLLSLLFWGVLFAATPTSPVPQGSPVTLDNVIINPVTPQAGNFTTISGTLTGSASSAITATNLSGGTVAATTISASSTITVAVPDNVSASVPTVASGTTIAVTTPIAFISGTTAIATITAPAGCTNGCQITLIPTGLWTTTATGNIAIASTAVVSKALIMTYAASTSKWYPSY